MILYVNSCVRANSRTNRLAKQLLADLGEYEELKLEQLNLQPLTGDVLTFRMERVLMREYTNPLFDYAKQFAAADTIVMAAPYWDLSFPALLKTYLEHIYVMGIVTYIDKNGKPHGLCKAQKLYYVTTAGGPYDPTFSYDCIKKMAKDCFGIPQTQLIYTEMMDVDGFDPEDLLINGVKTLV